MKNDKIYKNSSGITLVALAITIIVLLILGAISIMSLTGDDGAINQAIEAKNEADYKQAKTEVNEEWYILQNETRKQDNSNQEMANKLKERLKQRIDEEQELEDSQNENQNTSDPEVTYIAEDRKLAVKYKGKDIEISLEGEVTEHDSGNITISSHPQDVETLEGLEARFSITATGKGNIQYQWYYTSDRTATVGEKIQGATSSTYVIPQTNLANRGYYYCEAISSYQGVTRKEQSDKAQLTVNEGINDITISPAELTVAKGKKIQLEAITSGVGTITYKWYRNETNSNQGGTQLTEATTSSTYENTNAQLTDKGYYYCVATQTYGTLTNTVTSATVSVDVMELGVTYDYGINQNYPAETYTNTGYTINWDNDFTIEATVNVSELGKRYLVFGGYDANSIKELNVEVNSSNQLRVHLGMGRT